MKLWIIRDDEYSGLRTANGCNKFSDLSTQSDALEIRRLASMLGIRDENVREFRGSTKRQLNDYYTSLKREYSTLIK